MAKAQKAKMTRAFTGVLIVAMVATESVGGLLARQALAANPDIRLFFQTLAVDEEAADPALEQIAAAWKDGYAALLWDLARFMRRPQRLTRFLEQQTGQRFGDDLVRWHQWI